MTSPIRPHGPVWRALYFPRPLPTDVAVAALHALAVDPTSPRIVLETRAAQGDITYLVGAAEPQVAEVTRRLTASIPQLQLTRPAGDRRPVAAAAGLHLSTRHRPLSLDVVESVSQQLHAVLAALRDEETAVLQVILGPRRVPLSVPNQSPSSVVMPWWQTALHGDRDRVDPEKRAALRSKLSLHGFAASVRIGVSATSRKRRGQLITSLYSALRLSEAPGLKARLRSASASRLDAATAPLLWPLRLNAAEVVAICGWPFGDDDLPGLPPLHPRQVAPAALARPRDLVVANASAPGVEGQLGYSLDDAMRSTWVLGPTGVGKTTLLLNRIAQDLKAGRGVVVIEPKDLVAEVLKIVPDKRRDDVVLLDPANRSAVVGINPLAAGGRSPELVADSLLATFRALYDDQLGPRSTDILSNSLSVLARHPSASLVMLGPLLTNPGFRRSLTAAAIKADPISAGPFWAWYEALSDDARSQVLAPLSNKLRPLLRPQLRAVLGQRNPRISVRRILADSKVLLVPLQPGVIGPDAAQLLAATVIAELWTALRARAALPEHQRPPVMIYIDEVEQYLRTPVDLADALATSRSLRGSWALAHQFRQQLTPAMLAAFEGNVRSRVVFQLNPADARAMAAGQRVLEPEDFGALPAFHVYAQLLRGNSLQPWASGVTLPEPPAISDAGDIRRRSRELYAQSLDDIEAGFAELLNVTTTGSGPATGRRRRTA